MKDIYQVLKQKEQELSVVVNHVRALKIAAELCMEEADKKALLDPLVPKSAAEAKQVEMP